MRNSSQTKPSNDSMSVYIRVYEASVALLHVRIYSIFKEHFSLFWNAMSPFWECVLFICPTKSLLKILLRYLHILSYYSEISDSIFELFSDTSSFFHLNLPSIYFKQVSCYFVCVIILTNRIFLFFVTLMETGLHTFLLKIPLQMLFSPLSWLWWILW